MFGQSLPNKNKNTTVRYSDLVIPNWGTKQGPSGIEHKHGDSLPKQGQ
jgi:hypothetical protein